jgi:hypothetical protein
MQSLSDDEQKGILGEVPSAQLEATTEYVKDVPGIKRELHQVNATVNDINERLMVIEHVVHGHEADITSLQQKVA